MIGVVTSQQVLRGRHAVRYWRALEFVGKNRSTSSNTVADRNLEYAPD